MKNGLIMTIQDSKKILFSLRYEQFLLRPCSSPRPANKVEAMKPQWVLKKAENACVNLRLRLALGRELSEPHRQRVQQIRKLGQHILGIRVNGLRVLLAHLSMDESKSLKKVASYNEKGKISIVNLGVFFEEWNDLLMRLYQGIESSNYELNADLEKLFQSILIKLQKKAPSIAEEILKNPQEKREFLESMALLSDALENPQEWFPFLLMRSTLQTENKLDLNTVQLYKNVLSIYLGTVKRYIAECSDRLTKAKSSLKKNFLESFLRWQKDIEAKQSLIGKIPGLFEAVQRGDQEAFFKLRDAIVVFTESEIQGRWGQLIVPLMDQLRREILLNDDFKEIASGFDVTIRQSHDWFVRISDGIFFDTLSSLVQSCSLIDALRPHLAVRSPYLTPLDLLRSLWTAPYLDRVDHPERSKTIGKIEMIFQILQKPVFNVYGKGLAEASEFLDEFEQHPLTEGASPTYAALKQLQEMDFYEPLLAWLRAPLMHRQSQGNAEPFFRILLNQFDTYVKTMIHASSDLTEEEKRVFRRTPVEMCSSEIFNMDLKKLDDLEGFCLRMRPIFSLSLYQIMIKIFGKRIVEKTTQYMVDALFLEEDLRCLYLKPFLKMAEDLALNQPKRRAQEIKKRPHVPPPPVQTPTIIEEQTVKSVKEPIPLTMGEALEGLIPGASDALKYHVKQLVTLFQEPLLIEPMYHAAARCLEAKLQPDTNHQLIFKAQSDEEKKWLRKMQDFLPTTFEKLDIDPSVLWDDMRRTLEVLGAHEYRFSEPQWIEFDPREYPEMNALLSSCEDLTERTVLFSCQEIPNEEFTKWRMRSALSIEIARSLPRMLQEINDLMSLCEERACPAELIRYLMLKTGQVVEGALKLNLLNAPIASPKSPSTHCCFEKVGDRPRYYDHQIVSIYDWVQRVVPLSRSDVHLLNKWNHFSTWARYPNDMDEPHAHFLKDAELLYQDYHTEAELRRLRFIGHEGGDKTALLQLQRDLLLPEVKQLLEISHHSIEVFLGLLP